jgi:PAS domain S-box-containing protein
MARFKAALRQAAFLLRGGNQLNGWDDEPEARGFHLLLAVFLVWVGINLVLVIPFFAALSVLAGGIMLVMAAVAVAALGLLHRGRRRAAAALFLGAMWCESVYFSLFGGGVHSPGTALVIILTLGAGWLLGRPAALGFAAAAILLSFIEALLEYTGHPLPIYCRSTPVSLWSYDVGIVLMVVFPMLAFLDAQRRRLAALRESEERYRRLSNASFDGVVIHKDCIILDANLAFVRIHGYDELDELIGRNGLDLLLTPESHDRVLQRIERREYGPIELTGVRKDGSTFALEIESEPVKYQGGDARRVACRDITERKRAQEELRVSEENYRRLIEEAGDGVVLEDLDGRFLVVNPAFCKMLGYAREEMLQLHVLDTYFPAERAIGERRLREIRSGAHMTFERLMLRKDGTGLLVEVNVRRLDDGRQQAIVRDITERKRAEAELRATEENYRRLIEEAGDGVFLVDGGGRFLVVNPAFCKMLGYTREEMLQLNILDTYLPGERDLGERRLGEIRGGAHVTFERFMRRKDGTALLVEASARRIKDGRQQAIVRDITERKRAENALRESERKSRALLDLSFGFIGLLSLDGTLLDANRTALETAGAKREDVLGRPFWEVPAWSYSPELQERLRAAVRTAASGETVRFEAPLRAADGSIHPVDFSLKPWRNEAGQVVMLIPEGRDITELKRASEERALLEAQLYQAQKMESIGRLAGGVAHDFNNLLTVINGYSRLILDALAEGDPLRESLEEINHAGERAAGLTQRLLAFSRKQVLQPRVLDLNRVVRETEPMLARLMGEDVEVCVELHAEAATVCADPNQLEQVIMNLAVNARDAMPHGGKLSIGTAVVEREGSLAQTHPAAPAGRYAVLVVADTGVGMDEETRQRIFEPFFTTKEIGKGTGLGLSMIQGVVEQSGGSVDVASELGRGTTFTIYLPWVEDTLVGAREPEPLPSPWAGARKTILVVEDQQEVREYVAAALMAYGYRVIQADSAAEALPLCERERSAIDLVLTDVVMPRLSGGDLANLLWKRRPGTRVLFMSGHNDDAIARDGAVDRSVEFIQKPFSPRRLAIKVGEMLAAPVRPAHILVADDEAGVRGFLREVLESAGYEVTEAADGDQALREARAGRVDLVITDLVMPGREGLETIRALRKDAPGVGIIAITGALGVEFLEIARALGAQAVLSKPLDAGLLLSKVAELLHPQQ